MSDKHYKHSTSSGLSEALKVGIEVIIALGVKDYLKPSIEYLNKPEVAKIPFIILLLGSLGIIFYVGFGSLKWFEERLATVSKIRETPFEFLKIIFELIYIAIVLQITYLGEQLAHNLLEETVISQQIKLIAESAVRMGKLMTFIMVFWALWRVVHLAKLHWVKDVTTDEHDGKRVTLHLITVHVLFALIWLSYWRYGINLGFSSETLSNIELVSRSEGIISMFFLLFLITFSWNIWELRTYHCPNLYSKEND